MRRSGFRKSSIVCMIRGELHRKTVRFPLPAVLFCYNETYGRDTERMEAHTRRKPLVQRLESKQRVCSFASFSSFLPFSANIHPSVIHKPYPTTHWCPVPPEDKTNKPFCRPLPVKVKPPPPKAPAPVVGSSTWVDTENGPRLIRPRHLRVRGRGSRRVGMRVREDSACVGM